MSINKPFNIDELLGQAKPVVPQVQQGPICQTTSFFDVIYPHLHGQNSFYQQQINDKSEKLEIGKKYLEVTVTIQ